MHELFGQSELIVRGTIEEVKDKTFLLGEFEVLHGPNPDKPLEIKRFIDWSGNSRWSGYRVGQEVLLFLAGPEDASNADSPPWNIRGYGGEGEMPVEHGFVYLHGLFLEGFQRQRFTVQHGTLDGYRFHLDAFLAALKGYNRCFRFAEGPQTERSPSIVQQCDDETLAIFCRQSALNRYLVELTLQDIQTRS
ncbi:hypothetical protein GCM10007160_38210 [Litchfieldella qijiaojingensis]|uniref:Uncharacterized protein n=1 Tax=Litchfieldella qijiaojingensis TaxID=980347 RepID=A0ABQ2Z7G0_9GAMM|nr:hypothetical protein GCM10007160_38210 [Halomonas qijiaojingensis]